MGIGFPRYGPSEPQPGFVDRSCFVAAPLCRCQYDAKPTGECSLAVVAAYEDAPVLQRPLMSLGEAIVEGSPAAPHADRGVPCLEALSPLGADELADSRSSGQSDSKHFGGDLPPESPSRIRASL